MPATKLNIVKARTFELDPAKFYLCIFEHDSIGDSDVIDLNKYLEAQGIKGITMSINGNPKNIKIVETQTDVSN